MRFTSTAAAGTMPTFMTAIAMHLLDGLTGDDQVTTQGSLEEGSFTSVHWWLVDGKPLLIVQLQPPWLVGYR
jgi:hypothetical protein